MNRFLLALKAFWRTLTDPAFAARVEPLFEATPGTGPDLRVLAVLQRDGRLIDFLQEDIDGYPTPRSAPRSATSTGAAARRSASTWPSSRSWPPPRSRP